MFTSSSKTILLMVEMVDKMEFTFQMLLMDLREIIQSLIMVEEFICIYPCIIKY